MAYKVLSPIRYGKVGKKYVLNPGDVLNDSFFLKADRIKLLEDKCLMKTREDPTVDPDGVAIPQLADLQDMNVTQVKEFLDAEFDVTKLEKYLDQEEKAGLARRKTVVIYIQKRISELTDYEYPRVQRH